MAVKISYTGTLDILRISDLYGGKFVHSNKMLLTNLLLFFSITVQTSVATFTVSNALYYFQLHS